MSVGGTCGRAPGWCPDKGGDRARGLRVAAAFLLFFVTPCCPHFETHRAGRATRGTFVPRGLGSRMPGLTWRRPPSR